MKMKSDSFTFEEWLFPLAILTGFSFLAFLGLDIVLPFNNYLGATGTIRFLGEKALISEVEGVVTEVFKLDHVTVSQKEPILRIENNENINLAKSLDYRIAYLNIQIIQLQRFHNSLAVDGRSIDLKKLELRQLQQERRDLDNVTVNSTLSGYFYFLNAPKSIIGSYIRKGDVVGYQYRSPEKVVYVDLSNEWIDRLSEASVVKMYYKHPVSYFSRILPAHIESIHANTEGQQFQVECRIDAPLESTESFRPGTQVKINFLVKSTSLFQEIFGFDIYGNIRRKMSEFASR